MSKEVCSEYLYTSSIKPRAILILLHLTRDIILRLNDPVNARGGHNDLAKAAVRLNNGGRLLPFPVVILVAFVMYCCFVVL